MKIVAIFIITNLIWMLLIHCLHKQLEQEFGSTKRRGGSYRHYGIDVVQSLTPGFDQYSVLLSQSTFLSQLSPVNLEGAISFRMLLQSCHEACDEM